MELSEHDRTELQLLEEGLWRAETRFDRGSMERVLAPRFFEFGRSGRAPQFILAALGERLAVALPPGDHRCIELQCRPLVLT